MEIVYEDVKWIELANGHIQCRVSWLTLFNRRGCCCRRRRRLCPGFVKRISDSL
jgi:hypothetical protein